MPAHPTSFLPFGFWRCFAALERRLEAEGKWAVWSGQNGPRGVGVCRGTLIQIVLIPWFIILPVAGDTRHRVVP